jgi:hypothetical protein
VHQVFNLKNEEIDFCFILLARENCSNSLFLSVSPSFLLNDRAYFSFSLSPLTRSTHSCIQVDDAAKAEVSAEALAAAREMGQKGLAERLKDIDMGKGEWDVYEAYYHRIATQVAQLRTVLESLESKASERVWLKHQSSGELDDSKLVDGMAGERLVFKRRGESSSPFRDPNSQVMMDCWFWMVGWMDGLAAEVCV